MNRVLVIAEAGVNHNGDLAKAIELVHRAAEAEADIVKFQTFKAAKLSTSTAEMAEYQKRNMSAESMSQRQMLEKLELQFEDHHRLIEECRKCGIGFLSTAFDFESLDFLISLKLGLWKIPSGEITNLPYLERIARLRERVIISTGMAELHEVEATLKVFLDAGVARDQLTVLHCTTDYPAQMTDVNLTAMVSMGRDLNVSHGYSDHTLGIEIPIAAVALGASVIEKHFTLDRSLPGPDHKASLEPQELKAMVRSIRNVEIALGDGKKAPSTAELANRKIARKSLVAARPITKGEVFTESNLTTSRPGNGVSPMKWHEYLGARADKNYEPGELI